MCAVVIDARDVDENPNETPFHGAGSRLEQVRASPQAAGIRTLTVRQLRSTTVMADENLWFEYCVKQRTGDRRIR